MRHKEFIHSEKFCSFHEALKLKLCPYCKAISTLNLHGFLRGKNDKNDQKSITRARRVFCSNRGNAAGCGRTFAIYFSSTIPDLAISTSTAWDMLYSSLKGISIFQYYQSLNWIRISLCTCYRFLTRFKRCLFAIRTNLVTNCARINLNLGPDKETIRHLCACMNMPYPEYDHIAEYQVKFQTAFC